MKFLTLFVFSISMSIDALGIGISYGIYGIQIDQWAAGIVGIISGVTMGASLLFGEFLASVFPPGAAGRAGAFLMAAVGIAIALQGLRMQSGDSYDKNHSRKIEIKEGFLLGAALAADSLAAGIAAAAAGSAKLYLAPAVGVLQFLFLLFGSKLSSKLPPLKRINRKVCAVLSGLLLILLAGSKLL